MADLLTFPVLPLTKCGRPLPWFDTAVQAAPSGSEGRVGRRSVPRYRITLHLQLRTWLGEDQTLIGFFETVGGMRDSFLYTYTDPAGGSTTYRCRFDEDSLADVLEYEGGGLYSGSIDLVTVIA